MKKVIVASKNPVKLEAVKIGFEKMFSKTAFEFEGISVTSGVNDQPLTNEETLQGAIKRSENAFSKITDADFWVGVEGGIEVNNSDMSVFAWIVVKSNKMQGKGRTAEFFLPQKVVELISEGKELGEADDIVFGRKNSKQKAGAVGILTDNIIDRAKLYSEAVIMALIPFKNLEIY